ncbi:hypothetical protein HT031_005917 [Scenedesmus sp. PABB004]|nr:hypothetical protein HT031_005917 [Scenedesmus sp. PABB004]
MAAPWGLFPAPVQPASMDQDVQQGGKGGRDSERQMRINRLVGVYRDEAKQLFKDVHRGQYRWRNELEAAGVVAGVAGLQLAKPKRRRLPWRAAERDALKRQLIAWGVGRWKEIHAALSGSLRGFAHGPGDVEDAAWHLLGELQGLLPGRADRALLARLMAPIAERGLVSTPGAPYANLEGAAKGIVRRLAAVSDFQAAMPALLASEAVGGILRALVATLPPESAPAPWWDVEADVALLVGLHRHGFANYDAVRRDASLDVGLQPAIAAAGRCRHRRAPPGSLSSASACPADAPAWP